MPDLRAWLNEVDKLGQLMTVNNVHWGLEFSTAQAGVKGQGRDQLARLSGKKIAW